VGLGAFTRNLGPLHVHFGMIVREIQADDIDAGLDQLVEDLRVFRARSDGGDNLGSTQQEKPL
jgi:hypothetical protein